MALDKCRMSRKSLRHANGARQQCTCKHGWSTGVAPKQFISSGPDVVSPSSHRMPKAPQRVPLRAPNELGTRALIPMAVRPDNSSVDPRSTECRRLLSSGLRDETLPQVNMECTKHQTILDKSRCGGPIVLSSILICRGVKQALPACQ